MRVLLLALLATVGGCDRVNSQNDKLKDAQYRATMQSRGIGRFQIVPASGSYPPLLLDTVTGCVDQIHQNTNTAILQKLPIDADDRACVFGAMPRDIERSDMEILRK